MKQLILSTVFITGLILGGCSVFKVAEIDPATGYFPGNTFAKTIINKPIDLNSMKSLVLVTCGDFVKGQVQNIGFFDKVIDTRGLEKEIIINGLQDKIPSLNGQIGINNAYTHYKPFLWLRCNVRGEGTNQYAQFILTDPATLEDIFLAEEHLDYVWSGVNDQTVWYPLSNSLVKYIEDHSKSTKSNSI